MRPSTGNARPPPAVDGRRTRRRAAAPGRGRERRDVDAMSATYRYPFASLLPDGLRALAGLAFTGLPLAMLPVEPWFGMVLAAGVALFGVFGVLTALRARTEVRVDDDGIEVSAGCGPGRDRDRDRGRGRGRGRLRWSGLRGVKLRYFAVRRERERERGQGRRRGWMQLVLKGDGRVVRIDSRLDGFDDVLRRSASAAAGLRLDPVTRANFEAAGAAVAPDPAEEPFGAGVGDARDARNVRDHDA